MIHVVVRTAVRIVIHTRDWLQVFARFVRFSKHGCGAGGFGRSGCRLGRVVRRLRRRRFGLHLGQPPRGSRRRLTHPRVERR